MLRPICCALLASVAGLATAPAQDRSAITVRVSLRDGRDVHGTLLADLRHGVLLDEAGIGRRWLPRDAVRWVFHPEPAIDPIAPFGPDTDPATFRDGLRTTPAHHVGIATRPDRQGEILWIAAAPLASPASLDRIVRLLQSCDDVTFAQVSSDAGPSRQLADLLGAELTADSLPGNGARPSANPDALPTTHAAALAAMDALAASGFGVPADAAAGPFAAIAAAAATALDRGATDRRPHVDRLGIVVPAVDLPMLEQGLAEHGFRSTRRGTIDWRPRAHATTTRLHERSFATDGLDAEIAALTPAGARVSTWLSPADGPVIHATDPFAIRAAASAIKTAYLVELFASFEGALDEPLPGADAILDDPDHPALVHFDPAQRAEIRQELRGRSVRDLAGAMIHGRGVSNAVYNAAANVVTAALGGPEELSRRLAERFGEGAAVRRYMLAARDRTGDNEASAGWFARVLRRVATGRLAVHPDTVAAIRAVLFHARTDDDRRIWFKSGALDSDPMVRIATEIVADRDGATWVIAVVVERDRPTEGAGEAAAELARARDAITALLRDRTR